MLSSRILILARFDFSELCDLIANTILYLLRRVIARWRALGLQYNFAHICAAFISAALNVTVAKEADFLE